MRRWDKRQSPDRSRGRVLPKHGRPSPKCKDKEKVTRTKTQTTMNDVAFVELPETATMLETGIPQAIALRKENVVESELTAIETLSEAQQREADARDVEMKRLRDEKRVVEEEAAAMRRRIAELEAQLNPLVAVTALMMETEPKECIARNETPVVLSHKLANDKPSLPALPKLPAVPLYGNSSGNNGTISPPAPLHDNSTISRADREAVLIGQDKAALKSFALQVDVLKKYLPMCGSKKAAGLHEVITGQIIKFSLFITKKSEEL